MLIRNPPSKALTDEGYLAGLRAALDICTSEVDIHARSGDAVMWTAASSCRSIIQDLIKKAGG